MIIELSDWTITLLAIIINKNDYFHVYSEFKNLTLHIYEYLY
jgi:hypothetical protein